MEGSYEHKRIVRTYLGLIAASLVSSLPADTEEDRLIRLDASKVLSKVSKDHELLSLQEKRGGY